MAERGPKRRGRLAGLSRLLSRSAGPKTGGTSAEPAGPRPEDRAGGRERGGPAPSRREERPPPSSALASPAVSERRRALRELIEGRVGPEHVEALGRLLLDPDREIRGLALEALGQQPALVPDDVVRRALQDPVDDVRAAAVGLAAARGRRALDELVRIASDHRWPLSQRASLEVLPGLLAAGDLADRELSALLSTVARLEPAQVPEGRARLADLARAIGVDRLIQAARHPDDRRIGAVRLLVEEGSPEALAEVAGRSSDPSETVRGLARTAAARLGTAPPEVTVPPPPGAAPPSAVDERVLAALAQALRDPDPSVRDRARGTLREAGGATLEWVRRSLSSDDLERVSLAALVTESLSLEEAAGPLLERAAGVPAEARGGLVAALDSLALRPDALAALLPTIDRSVRPEAIRVLWQAAGRAILPHLGPSLKDPSGPVRMAALDVLSESGDPRVVEAATGLLRSDSSPAVRATAVKVLARAGRADRLASLELALEDPDPDVRATAVEVLPEGAPREAAELLLAALGDEVDRVWQGALRHLADLGREDLDILWTALRACRSHQRDHLLTALEPTDGDLLARLVLDHLGAADPSDRALAVELAARAGTPESAHAALRALQDPAPLVRKAAARSLSLLNVPAALPALGAALGDPDPEIRVEVVRVLGLIDDENVLPHLVSALKDPEVTVREVAGEVLAQWSSPAAAERLVEALRTPELRSAAADLLLKMGPPAVEGLVDALIDGDREIRPTAGQLLGRLAGAAAFAERLSSMDPVKRLRAVEALGAIGGPAGVEGLIRTLFDPDEGIRIRALQLLGELGDDRAFDAVKRCFLGDPVPEVVAAAEEALRRLRPEERPQQT